MDYLSPIPESVLSKLPLLEPGQLGQRIRKHTELEGLPSLDGVKVAFVGVHEDRRAYRNTGCDSAADHIRPFLYQLHQGNWDFEMVDLGNIYAGEKHFDTVAHLSNLCEQMLKKGIITITIGGSQDLTYANYRAYDALEKMVNIVSIDSRLDVGSEGRDLDHQSYVSHLVLQEPHNLYNFTNIGYQTYFCNPEEILLIENLFFEAVRLGEAQGNMPGTEPLIREADLVSVDLSAVRQSYNPGTFYTSPHGFSGNELCAMMRYAGMSDTVSQLGIYEYNPRYDQRGQSAHLCAHALWYFLEGFSLRFGDFPVGSRAHYEKYTVLLTDDDPIDFYKSPNSGRWWMEVPKGDIQSDRFSLVPCSYEDYQEALEGKIPKRWWKAQQKA